MKLWDAVTASALIVAAVLEAIDGAIKNSPHLSEKMPDFVGGITWSFLPLGLVAIAAIIWIVEAFRKEPPQTPQPSVPPAPPEWKVNLEPVQRMVFTNQEVVIDGKMFEQCTFTNATLTYNGTGLWSFIGCQFHGSVMAQTLHKPAKAWGDLFTFLNGLPHADRATMVEKDRHTGEIRYPIDLLTPKKTEPDTKP
jgi:hypothetical protein